MKEFKTVSDVWEHLAQTVGCDIIASRPEKPFTEPEMLVAGRGFASEIIEEAKKFNVKFGRCLDFGCGIGRVSEGLSDHFEETIGIDTSPTFINSAIKYGAGKATYILSDNVEELKGQFDFIFSHLVFIHYDWDGIKLHLERLASKLSPDGTIRFDLFTTDNPEMAKEDDRRIKENIIDGQRSIIGAVNEYELMNLLEKLNWETISRTTKMIEDRMYNILWMKEKR